MHSAARCAGQKIPMLDIDDHLLDRLVDAADSQDLSHDGAKKISTQERYAYIKRRDAARRSVMAAVRGTLPLQIDVLLCACTFFSFFVVQRSS